jgi:hypothetical protein
MSTLDNVITFTISSVCNIVELQGIVLMLLAALMQFYRCCGMTAVIFTVYVL